LRIAAPLALVGALLAEWLATGQGLGYGLLNAAAASDYNGLWARVVLITLYSTVIYQLVGIAEGLVMRRFGSAAK
jgi:ABC-type nitrate/sulfonate/bicarbonate transport system permease component